MTIDEKEDMTLYEFADAIKHLDNNTIEIIATIGNGTRHRRYDGRRYDINLWQVTDFVYKNK